MMEVVNPYGRQVEDVINDDYASAASTRCKCSSGLYYSGLTDKQSQSNCACTDNTGTVGTRVKVG